MICSNMNNIDLWKQSIEVRNFFRPSWMIILILFDNIFENESNENLMILQRNRIYL